jgi:Rps23 Pro-64 3,4-dihydroxylase Tpa1-like proline 4-hydroxylase
MIDGRHDPCVLAREYAAAQPFPHIVVDGFLDGWIANRAAAELETFDVAAWHRDEHSQQVNKAWMENPENVPQTAATVLRYMNSEAVCAFMSRLTGIDQLLPDDTYLGGGVHVSNRGGRLGLHADFNLHPRTGLHRRVNALLYMNREWRSEWRGELELWSKDLTRAERSIEPLFNRLVVFTITDDAVHGVPTPLACPDDRRRLSLALYYYTTERPEAEKAPFHWAMWRKPAH